MTGCKGLLSGLLPTLLLSCSPAPAQEVSLQLHGLSVHSGAGDWNGSNLGAGVRYQHTPDTGMQVGVYENSLRKTTTYALLQYTPLHSGGFHIGAFGGLASGYSVPYIAGLMGTYDLGRFTTTVRWVPETQGLTPNVLALEVGIKL